MFWSAMPGHVAFAVATRRIQKKLAEQNTEAAMPSTERRLTTLPLTEISQLKDRHWQNILFHLASPRCFVLVTKPTASI